MVDKPSEESKKEKARRFEIHGTVTGHDGIPLAGARVVVWWQHIRERTELAAGETSEHGRYHLSYRIPDDAPRPVLLVVEGQSERLHAPLYSPQTQAQPVLQVDLNFEPSDQSEWATLVRSIEPLIGDLKLGKLVENSTHQDISFLARETGRTTEVIMRVAVSARLEAAFKVPAPAFYAFLRQQVPASLPTPLLDASQSFTLIDALVHQIGSFIFNLSAEVQLQTLTAAVALDLIGSRFTARLSQLVSELQALHTTDLLNQPYLIGNTTLAQVLNVASLAPEKQQAFAQALATNTQSMRGFWRTLGDGQHGFTAAEASTVERTLSIGSFVKNYVPLVQTLSQGFTAGTYTELADLARLSVADWVQMVNQTGAPPGIDAAGTSTPAEVFAKVVYARVTRTYPTVALTSRITGGKFVKPEQQRPLTRFFQNNLSLELVKDNIPAYLSGLGAEAFAGIDEEDRPAVIANAKGLQRVLRVAPNPDVAQTLLGLGFNSATQIAALGKQQFFNKATAAGLTKPEANQAFQVAAVRYASLVSLYSQLNYGALGVWPKGMGDLTNLDPIVQQAVQQDPTLTTLFGSQDYCATDDCASVLSPAAYLCDLLLWLRNHQQGAKTALDVLDSRRPDIRNLLLNCPNTDTELPYIDLVNELLADKISPATDPTSTINPTWKQTSEGLTSDQLTAAPQYFNQGAHIALFDASYPQTLPYSTGLDELRTYLQQWNVPLWQLRQALLPVGGGSVAQQAAVAAERLGMNVQAEDLVTIPNFVSASVAWNTSDFSATPPNGLATVPAFLQATSLTYESLLELLQVSWVQGGLGITLQGVDDTCDTSTQALSPAPLDLGFLDRAHRFLRLWNATGNKMWELDLLLGAPSVGGGVLNQQTLVSLQAFWQLQQATKLAVNQLLAFYQDMDIATHRDPDGSTTTSLYGQVFLNPTVTWVAPDPDLASLPSGGPIGDPILSDHVKAIQPALGVTAADAATLFALTDNQLTLENLSLIYRVNSLAVASKFSVSGLLTIAGLLSPAAATPLAAVAPLLASPASTLSFLKQATSIQQSGISVDALTYLLTPPSAATSGGWTTTTQMTPANVAATLGAVQQAVLTLRSASTTLASPITAAQPSITVTSDIGFPSPNFYAYVGSEIMLVTSVGGTGNTTWTVLRGQQGTTAASALSGATVTPTIGDMNGAVTAAVAATAHSSTNSPLTNAVAAVILQNLNVPGTGQPLLTVLMDPSLIGATGTMTIGGSPAAGDTLQAILTDQIGDTFTVSYTLTATDSGSVNQTASDFAKVINASPSVVGLHAFLAPCAVSGAVITLTPLAPGAPGSSVTSTNTAAPGGAGHVSISPDTTATIGLPNFLNQFLAVQLYDKVGVLVRGLHMVSADLTWLLDNAAVYGGLDLTQLPVSTGQPALSLSPLLTTLLVIKLARMFTASLPSSPLQTLYDVIGGVSTGALATEAQVQSALASITGWPLPDIEAFSPALRLAYPASYTQPAVYDSLRTLEVMSSAVTATGPVVAAASTALASPVTAAQPSITVTSDIGFPSPSFYVSIGSEILLVTSVGGADNTTWTVLRGQQGTTAASALVGAVVAPTYGAQVVTWGNVPADEISAESLAASALGTLKAQQPSDDAWLALAPTLMNPIRENRSAALQAYLIGQRDGGGNLIYADSDGLFSYFLIDTQMSSCQLTSRSVQAYIAVQIFVERCLMNMEAPAVVVDLTKDDTWNQWQWMSRYRVWEANREVFLFPENWLIESERPSRTETYQTFEQEVRQGESTADYLETVVLNYIDRLDGISDLRVTGTCEDSATGTIYVVARTLADPPIFYLRTYEISSSVPGAVGMWSGWAKIPLDIKAHQAVPAFYRGRVCLFWPEVKLSNEPTQSLPAAQQMSTPPSQNPDRYVALGLYFSVFRNGAWAPAQTSKDKLFDKPLLYSTSTTTSTSTDTTDVLNVTKTTSGGSSSTTFGPGVVSDLKSVAALYTLKVQTPAPTPGYGANLFIDVFRQGPYDVLSESITTTTQMTEFGGLEQETLVTHTTTTETANLDPTRAVQVGRAVFDGRFGDLELNTNLGIMVAGNTENLYAWAQRTYGPDAETLLPLNAPDADLTGEPNLLPKEGAQVTKPAPSGSGPNPTAQLTFTAVSALNQTPGTLLRTAQLPFRVIGPDTDINPGFDPTSYFFFQDNRRCYYVESQKYYWTGSMFSPVVPSNPGTVPYQERYYFHVFYHAFPRLFWNQLAGGGFDLLYDPNLQQNPDRIDPSGADVFSFQKGYQPVIPPVWWDHDDVTGQDRQFLDFRPNAAYSVYNWELFYHIPLYIAQLLSQNQQFDDATTWFEYIFNPTRQGSDPVPQRFWIPKPLHDLNAAGILQQRINNLLEAVNTGDPTSVALVETWRNNPFNPFVLADMRNGVPYMKYTVMSYLDNLIAEGDNLFSTESREALSEATLLYVVASEILGPTPSAVPPPQHADESFDQLEPHLDAFANAMVEIENAIGGAGGGGGGSGGGSGEGIPAPQTFYFKIPPNEQLLGYWDTVADRLYKLRHCQTIGGAPLQLALFDAPIDPGLLIRAQAAGLDLTSVLNDSAFPVPNYRFTSLYTQALDFVNAVRAYGASLQAALEKTDAGALAILQQTLQQQLLSDGDQVLDWQVQAAQSNIDNLTQSYNLAQSKYNFNSSQPLVSPWEATELIASGAAIVINAIAAIVDATSSVAHALPQAQVGAAGAGGTPQANASDGGTSAGHSTSKAADALKAIGAGIEKAGGMAGKMGQYQRKMDAWQQAAKEAQIQMTQATAQLTGANLALQIAQQNQALHQEQEDDLQKQIDFLNDKFTSNSLYDWMVGSLSDTYFQSYRLAYQMCKQAERCYQFELGIRDSSFIQFGYWDSLYKGLLSGETLNNDLRRMQASYLQLNARRYELSRFVSLELLDPTALQSLLVKGKCDFDLPESLFDGDYPGHYNRRLTRVSVTVVYPNPGKFDNVKATLTLVANKVRTSTDASSGYPESPVGSDPRFVYSYAANSQKIATGNAQDDPGLFLTTISNNLSDVRYLPFENAGAISSWHLEMPQSTNELDLSTVGDVVLHLFYTALDGGAELQAAAQANNALSPPTSGSKLFSAQNDFAAPSGSSATPWQAFVAKPAAGSDQTLTLAISPSKFPPWTRGKTISVTSVVVVTVAWPPGNFVVEPQAPLPNADVTTSPVPGATEPYVSSVTVTMPPNTPLGTWVFKLRQASAADFHSLTSAQIGDVLLLVNYDAS